MSLFYLSKQEQSVDLFIRSATSDSGAASITGLQQLGAFGGCGS